VPTGYGLLVHEAGHAVHSRWHTPADTPPVVARVADLLEESRAEARHRGRRRTDRRWLRHTVTTLLDPGEAPVLPVALVEDVGVVDGEDVRVVESPAGRVPGGALVTVVICWCSF
jgi:hypothetical protein